MDLVHHVRSKKLSNKTLQFVVINVACILVAAIGYFLMRASLMTISNNYYDVWGHNYAPSRAVFYWGLAIFIAALSSWCWLWVRDFRRSFTTSVIKIQVAGMILITNLASISCLVSVLMGSKTLTMDDGEWRRLVFAVWIELLVLLTVINVLVTVPRYILSRKRNKPSRG